MQKKREAAPICAQKNGSVITKPQPTFAFKFYAINFEIIWNNRIAADISYLFDSAAVWLICTFTRFGEETQLPMRNKKRKTRSLIGGLSYPSTTDSGKHSVRYRFGCFDDAEAHPVAGC